MSEQKAFFYLKYGKPLELYTVKKSQIGAKMEDGRFKFLIFITDMGAYQMDHESDVVEYIVREGNTIFVGMKTDGVQKGWKIPCKNDKVAKVVCKHLFKYAGPDFVNAAL